MRIFKFVFYFYIDQKQTETKLLCNRLKDDNSVKNNMFTGGTQLSIKN